MIAVNAPFAIVPGIDGQPLDDGDVYVGVAGLNAEVNPVNLYWDPALTIPAGQPVKTINGFYSQSGTPGVLYANASDYSIVVKDKNAELVYSSLYSTAGYGGAVEDYDTVAALKAANLQVGELVRTKGYYAAGDEGGATYLIAAAAAVDGYSDHLLANGKIALLQNTDGKFNIRQCGAVGDGVADDSAAIQAAIDRAADTNKDGGVVVVPWGEYACANLIAKQSVTIDSGMRGVIRSNSGQRAPRFILNDNGFILGTSTTELNNFACLGIVFTGVNIASGNARGVVLGSDIALFGDSADVDCYKPYFAHCAFVNFRQEGFLYKRGNGCQLEQCFAENTLKDAAYLTQQRCSVAIYGNDAIVTNCEFTAQNTGAVSSANLYKAAFGFMGGTARANSFISDTVGETSDIGIVIDQRNVRMSNVRGDTNFGRGFSITQAGCIASSCTAFKNSQDTDNTYDGWYINANRCSFAACQSWSNAADTKKVRYGFNDVTVESIPAWRNKYVGCFSDGAVTAEIIMANSAFDTPKGEETLIADGDTTPSVEQYGRFRTNNTGATSITTFDDGYNGQELTIRFTDGNTTLVNSGTLITGTGGNKLVTAGRVGRFYNFNGVWICENGSAL